MINFFRRIRKQLADDNKPLKYMRYAIGEIVLVVVGILIALSINNWNEDQKKQKLKVLYRNSLVNDLSSDTLLLGRLIKVNYKSLNTLDTQTNRFIGPDTPIDTLIKIARDEFDPDINTRFKYNRNTINTLIASGNIDLFTIEFNEMLMALILLQDIERENAKWFSDVYSSKASRYSDNYPFSAFPQNSNLINSIWVDIDEKKFTSSFVSLIAIKGYAHYTFINEIENVREQTTIILEHMNKQN